MSTELREPEPLTPNADPEPTTLVATIRRLYFYLIATVTLLVGLSGLLSLLEILCDIWLGDISLAINVGSYVRNIVARSGSMLLVATPLFLIHWRIIQRSKTEPAEATSSIRKFFLYLISIISLGWGATLAGELLQGMIALLVGVPLAASDIWPSRWLYLLFGILVNGALFVYFQRQLFTDGDWGQESGWAGTWRRLYQAVIGLATLSALVFGLGLVLQTLIQAILPETPQDVGEYWTRENLSMGIAMALVGAGLWRFNWRNWQRIIQKNQADSRTALRRFYLYGSVIISALVTLVPAAMLLRQLLLILFGVGDVGASTGNSLATPLAYLPVGLIFWVWHWRFIQSEAARYGDTPESAQVRRIYYYAVAAIGLTLTWVGLVDVLRVMLDLLSPNEVALSGLFWTEQLANGLSLLAIGTPVWAFHWRAVQRAARQPGAEGEAERSSWPRRLYLYAVALAGALIILYYLTTVAYRFLLLVLGQPDVDLLGLETIDALARCAVTLVFWLLAVRAIRQDGRLGVEGEVGVSDTAGDSAEVIDMDATSRKAELEANIQRLETELAAARAELTQIRGDNAATSID